MSSRLLILLASLLHFSCAIHCYKAIGTKGFRPTPSHGVNCMGYVSSCYSLQTKEDVVGHIVEGTEYDCDNENVCAGMEGACLTMNHSVRCCCTYDLCNTAKRTVVLGSNDWKAAVSHTKCSNVIGIIFVSVLMF